MQELAIMKPDGDRLKKKIEFELAMISKQPHLPKGVSHDELEFKFDLSKL